ncbi:hypothetical protein D3C87_1550360 [compost metagenome]
MINLSFEIIRKNAELRAKLTTIQYYVADANYISDTLRFFTEIVRYNLPVIPGRDMEKVSYIIVNAFIGLVNTMNIDSPQFIHDPGITEEISRLLYNYLGMNPEASIVAATGKPKGDFI